VHVVRGGPDRPHDPGAPCSVETGWSRPENWSVGVMVTTAVTNTAATWLLVNVDRTIPGPSWP